MTLEFSSTVLPAPSPYLLLQPASTTFSFCSKAFFSRIGSRPSDHYFLSVCWFVCLFVCAVFLSRLWYDFDQTRTYVICLGL